MQTKSWGKRGGREGGKEGGRESEGRWWVVGSGGGQWLERDEKSMDKQVRGRLQRGSQRGEKLSI